MCPTWTPHDRCKKMSRGYGPGLLKRQNRTFVSHQGVNAMKITVMQVNNELASTGVSVYVDDSSWAV